jgi:hypothetical protein
MATEVVVTDEFKAWYESLSDAEQDRVAFSIGLLEERGVTLPHPYSSSIKGGSFALRELRTQADGDPLRTLYAFDPWRQAVLLIGGDKTGQQEVTRWHRDPGGVRSLRYGHAQVERDEGKDGARAQGSGGYCRTS